MDRLIQTILNLHRPDFDADMLGVTRQEALLMATYILTDLCETMSTGDPFTVTDVYLTAILHEVRHMYQRTN